MRGSNLPSFSAITVPGGVKLKFTLSTVGDEFNGSRGNWIGALGGIMFQYVLNLASFSAQGVEQSSKQGDTQKRPNSLICCNKSANVAGRSRKICCFSTKTWNYASIVKWGSMKNYINVIRYHSGLVDF